MRNRWLPSLAVVLASLLAARAASAQGLILPGAGGMHRSMAGASTAYGVDALGALYWNPAAISGLPGSEVVIGGEALIGDTHVGSSFFRPPINLPGPLPVIPGRFESGYTRSDSGVGLLPGIGVLYQVPDSGLSYGLGLVTLAGGSVNFPGDAANPILAPVGPFGRFVLGPQAATATVVAIEPTVSVQVTDRLAFGAGPMVDISVVSFDPAFFATPDDSNGDRLRTFPTGSHSRPFWGGGFRAGLTYRLTDHLVTGFSFTSPQWFETWKFNARSEVGEAITFRTQFSLPMVLSLGAAYTGFDRLLLSADVRYFDYQTTELLGEPVADGGAGWQNVWAVALGARYQMSDRLSVQLGYLYNENPIPSEFALFNTQLPGLVQHTLSAGAYLQLNESVGLALAYVHGFRNSITSQNVFPIGGVSGTLDTEYDSIAFGLHIKFGGPRCRGTCMSEVPCQGCVSAPIQPPATPPHVLPSPQ